MFSDAGRLESANECGWAEPAVQAGSQERQGQRGDPTRYRPGLIGDPILNAVGVTSHVNQILHDTLELAGVATPFSEAVD